MNRCAWTMYADLRMRGPWLVSWWTERTGPSEQLIIARVRWIAMRPI